MKVLFLDIDGVLNHDATQERIKGRGGLVDGFVGIDQALLKRFQTWLKDKDIKIVLSSTWRTDEGTMAELRANGIEWIDVTPRARLRGDEVAQWLAEHDVDRYAIIDDVDEFLFDQMDFLVLTNPRIGITDDDLKQIDAILGLDGK
jgi:hypothetical protein